MKVPSYQYLRGNLCKHIANGCSQLFHIMHAQLAHLLLNK